MVFNNRWVGGEQNRLRAFCFGSLSSAGLSILPFLELSLFENQVWSPTVCASGSIKPGAPKDRQTRLKYHGWKTAEALKESLRLQGLPDDFLSKAPFTLTGKHKVVGNGVPLPMGKAIAQAMRMALEGNAPSKTPPHILVTGGRG
jgi:DNA (cytosine-5)-methyltransferase 1